MAKEGKSLPVYKPGCMYINYWMDWAQFSIHLKKRHEPEGYSVCGFDTHVSGKTCWDCRVLEVLEPIDADDPLEKRVLVEPVRGKGMAVVDVVNGDVLPSYYPGSVLRLQIVALCQRIKYYPDQDAYFEAESVVCDLPGLPSSNKPRRICADDGTLFPTGFLHRHRVVDGQTREKDDDPRCDSYTAVKGIVKRLSKLPVQLDNKTISVLVACEVDTHWGSLTLIHPLADWDANENGRIAVGSIVSATCILSGDAMISIYENGPVYDIVHNLRLLIDSLATGGVPERLLCAMAEGCCYDSVIAQSHISGPQEIVKYIKHKAALMDEPRFLYHGELAVVTEAKEGSTHAIGERCAVLWQGETDNIVSYAFLTLDADGKILQILLDSIEGISVAVDTEPNEVPS